MPAIPTKISVLFDFLAEHHAINRKIQCDYIQEALSPDEVGKRALLLMNKALITQSSPRMDNLCVFFKQVVQAGAHVDFHSFRELATQGGEYELVQGLARLSAWGPKTAALFVKNLGYIQEAAALRERFWSDIDVLGQDQIRLPVDKVIVAIFDSLRTDPDVQVAGTSFQHINHYLRGLGYRDEQMLVWDDLWFWGFITQKNAPGGPRVFGWNEAKYWALPHTPKDDATIKKIKHLGETFLGLL